MACKTFLVFLNALIFRTSKSTVVTYVTNGVLLKLLKQTMFSTLILDEVHERSLELDLLLTVIKRMLTASDSTFNVILMSATANSEVLQNYFNGLSVLNGIYNLTTP